MSTAGSDDLFLLDVSRLVWRVWRGGHPTGIDRVCQAYVQHFGTRSQAVVQRSGFHFVLSFADSARLFEILLADSSGRRRDLIRLAARALPSALRNRARPGAIYLNVGHTGLNEASLPGWIADQGLRAVYLVHDLIPLTHPQFCRRGEAEKHARRMRNMLASAAGVIGNSRATLDDLAEFANANGLPMPPSVVAWISGGTFARDVRPRTLSRPHFVAVGTIEGRKNHLLLLDVWRRLVAEQGKHAPVLLILGQRGWQAERVFEQLDRPEELQGHVQELGTCNDEELAGWIGGARALLMPSFAEGFGLPVFEALELGTPVIASDLPVFREVGGGIPTYLDPQDSAAWKRTIEAFCADGPERQRQVAEIGAFQAPTWGDHFAKVEVWLARL